jgi:transcriptional regulator with XRE-family HTH domain
MPRPYAHAVADTAADEARGDGDWAAVASAINARVATLRMTQLDLAAKSGVSPATIREIQHNNRPRRRYGRTLAALSEALDWPADHLDAVLAGRPTTPTEPATPSPGDPVLDQLRAIREELTAIRQRLTDLEAALGRPAAGQ